MDKNNNRVKEIKSGMKTNTNNKYNNKTLDKIDKFTNTTTDLYECKKCQEREDCFLQCGETGNKEMTNNYVKAINYINTCHNIINEITKKMSENNANIPSPTLNMPDLPNFLALYTSLLYTNNANTIIAKSETCDNNNEEIKESFDFVSNQIQKSNPPLPPHCHKECEDQNKDECIKEIFARNLQDCEHKQLKHNLAERKVKDSAPIALIMDEVCNLANIRSQQNIDKNATENKKNLTSEAEGIKIDNVNKNWPAYESEDTDTECTTNSTVLNNNNEINFDDNYEDASKKNNAKTKIPSLTNKSSKLEEENKLPQLNIKIKSTSSKIEHLEVIRDEYFQEESHKSQDDSDINDNSTQSTPRKLQSRSASKNIKPKKMDTHNRLNSASVTRNLKDQNLNKKPINIHPRCNARQPVTAQLPKKSTSPQRVSFLDLKSTTLYSQGSETKLLNQNIKAVTKSQHYYPPQECPQVKSRTQHIVNQHVNTPLKRHVALPKRSTIKVSNKLEERLNTTNKNDPLLNYQHGVPKRQDKSTVAKIDNVPNDFFTETRRSKTKMNLDKSNNDNSRSGSMLSNKDDTDHFYTDSDIDEDHFQNAVEIACPAKTSRKN